MNGAAAQQPICFNATASVRTAANLAAAHRQHGQKAKADKSGMTI